MIMHIRQPSIEGLTQRIERLIYAIERKLPKPVRDDIHALNRADSEDSFRQAERNLRNSALDWSRAAEHSPHAFFATDYVRCILCGREVASKRGIEEHLSPYDDCPVYGAIVERAQQNYGQSAAREADIRRQAAADTQRENDRVLVDLSEKSVVREVSSWQRRSAADMTFALERLAELGFTEIAEEVGTATVTRWELRVGDIYILADPRHSGSIRFMAWSKETVDRYRAGKKVYGDQSVEINDRWRNELRKKLMVRLEGTLNLEGGALSEFYALPQESQPSGSDESPLQTSSGHSPKRSGASVAPAASSASHEAEHKPAAQAERGFDALTHAEVLAKSRSMSRKELIAKYRLTPAQASSRINAAIAWEKSRK